MPVGPSKWLEMSNEERTAYLRQEEADHARYLQSLTMEESLRMGFELMEMQKQFPMTCCHDPISISGIIRMKRARV